MIRKAQFSKKNRRFSFSNLLAKDVLTEQLEERIVPAYVSGGFGWAESLGASDLGGVGLEPIARSTATDSSGNIYQVGSFLGTVDFDAGPGIATQTAVGEWDAFIVKLDSSGQFVWVKSFSGLSTETGTSITLDANGNLLVTGYYYNTVDFDPNSGVTNLTSTGKTYSDTFIAKLDSDGNLMWVKSVSSIYNDWGRTITTDTSGNIIVGGMFLNTVDFDPGPNVQNMSSYTGQYDIFVLKLDSAGNFIWVKGILGLDNGSKNIYDIRTDGNNNVIIAGSYYGKIDLDPNSGVRAVTSVGSQDGFLVKLNSSGVFQWAQQVGSTGGEWVEGIAFDADNNLYVCGGFGGTVDFDPSINQVKKGTSGGQDAYLEKLSPNGGLLWVKTWGSAEKDYAKYLYIDKNNHLKVTGGFTGTVDFDPDFNSYTLTSKGFADVYVSVFDTGGNFFGVKAIGQPIDGDESYGMSLTPSGQPVLAGKYSGTTDFDPEGSNKSLPTIGGTNYFLTQWNRFFTKTILNPAESSPNGTQILTATIQNENNTSTTGIVTFTDNFNGVTSILGTGSVANGIATLALPSLISGTHSFSATYEGDSKNFNSKSNAISKSLASSTTAIVSSFPNSKYGQSVTYTAHVAAESAGVGIPSGTVNYYDGAVLIGSGSLNANGDSDFIFNLLTLGTHSIKAVYLGDGIFGTSMSSALTQTVTVGAPASLTIANGDAQSTIVATAFGNLLQVLLTDAYGNRISNYPVTYTINSNKASGIFATLSTVNTDINGIATAPKLTANTAAGNFTVTASVTGLPDAVFNLTNLPGAASKVVSVSGSNQSTTVDTAFAGPLIAKVTDIYANPISGVQINFTAPDSGASVRFNGPITVTSGDDGLVTSPSLSANTVSGSYNVVASAQNLSSAQFLLTNKSGQPVSIVKTNGNNQTTAVNTAFANPLSVKVSDSFGNPVFGVNVIFSGPATGSGVVFSGATTISTNTQGIATISGFKANTIVGDFEAQAYVNDQLNTTFSLSNIAGPASKLAFFGGNNQSAVVNSAYAAPLQLLVTDSFGNAVGNVPVIFTTAESGPGVIVTGSNQATSTSNGMVNWSAFIANKIAGSFIVSASLSSGASINFSLANTPGAVAAIVPVNGNNQSTLVNAAFPSALQVKVIDAFGNSVPNVPVTFAAPSTRASLQFTAGTIANTDSAGFAQSSAMMANGIIGTYNVTASTPGAASINFNMTNVAPTVSSMIVQQNALGRSFVRYVDLVLNDAATAKAIASSVNTSASRISMTNTGLTGTTKKVVTLKGLVTAVGNAIHIDFGSKGIGGNSASNAADGSYLISLDMDGNGSLETSRRFHRLLGDVNGDKIVNANDTNLVKANLNKSGFNIPGDSNGDGKVNATDSSYVKKAQKRKISV